MNFLAHCALAELATEDQRNELIAGGVLADFCKGPVPSDWPVKLQAGVRLHRRIDAHSNQHSAIRRSCDRLSKDVRRFAPIIIDIVADRCLTLCWQDYFDEPLTKFTERCYGAIQQVEPSALGIHSRGLQFLAYMEEEDLLASYDQWRHVERGIHSISRRLRRPAITASAMAQLPQLEAELTADFRDYFPSLVDEARRFTSALDDEVRE